jgi:hypothetical protein
MLKLLRVPFLTGLGVAVGPASRPCRRYADAPTAAFSQNHLPMMAAAVQPVRLPPRRATRRRRVSELRLPFRLLHFLHSPRRAVENLLANRPADRLLAARARGKVFPPSEPPDPSQKASQPAKRLCAPVSQITVCLFPHENDLPLVRLVVDDAPVGHCEGVGSALGAIVLDILVRITA